MEALRVVGKTKRKEFIGNQVYAELRDGELTLLVERGGDGTMAQCIRLSPEVWAALVRYMTRGL